MIDAAARERHRLGIAGFNVHQHVDRLVDGSRIERRIIEVADGRIGKAGACQFGARRLQLVRLQPRDPAGDDEIGLEGVDRRPQRLQHVRLHHRGRAEQARGDPRQQFALGQAVLDQAGVNIDRARQRNPVDGQFLIVDTIGRETGEQNPDQRHQTDDLHGTAFDQYERAAMVRPHAAVPRGDDERQCQWHEHQARLQRRNLQRLLHEHGHDQIE